MQAACRPTYLSLSHRKQEWRLDRKKASTTCLPGHSSYNPFSSFMMVQMRESAETKMASLSLWLGLNKHVEGPGSICKCSPWLLWADRCWSRKLTTWRSVSFGQLQTELSPGEFCAEPCPGLWALVRHLQSLLLRLLHCLAVLASSCLTEMATVRSHWSTFHSHTILVSWIINPNSESMKFKMLELRALYPLKPICYCYFCYFVFCYCYFVILPFRIGRRYGKGI